jgi:hypothetical protein
MDLDLILEQAKEAADSNQKMKIDPNIVADLIIRLRRFYVFGTDGCSHCETGRVSIWKQYDECLDCQCVVTMGPK